MSDVRNLIIIGSGPAGYTAALYAARARLRPLMFEGSVESGGALMNTTEVENYPGFAEGIQGPELMQALRTQAARFDAQLVADDVVGVDLAGPIKVVRDSGGTEHRARSVILAMGSAYRRLGIPGEDRLAGHGASWCATCDGFFFRNQDIAVVGGGDSAMEEATFLTRFARSVTVIHRRDTLRASKIMQDRAFANDKIAFCWSTAVTEILGTDKVEGLRLADLETGESRTLALTGVFETIGHDPRSELVKGQVRTDDEGYVVVESPSSRTDVPGVFAAGDLVDSTYRQAVTAAGTGCVAALDAERYLAGLEGNETDPTTDARAAAAAVEALTEDVETAGA